MSTISYSLLSSNTNSEDMTGSHFIIIIITLQSLVPLFECNSIIILHRTGNSRETLSPLDILHIFYTTLVEIFNQALKNLCIRKYRTDRTD